MITATFSARSQELSLKVEQYGASYRNSKTGQFSEAEVNDTSLTLLLQNDQVLLGGIVKASYTIDKKLSKTKIKENIVCYTYLGKDEKKLPVSLLYTLNHSSKQAIVEVRTKKWKNYFFGTYSSPDLNK